jgi:glycosyltransferase involved in cell wall biosynthesis
MIADDLTLALRERGHEVQRLMLPHDPEPEAQPSQQLAMRLLDVTDTGDRLIAIRPPSFLLKHPSKVLWMIHQDRLSYDLWGTALGPAELTHEAKTLRNTIHLSDQQCIPEAAAVFTNSRIVGARLESFNGVPSRVLYPPLGNSDGFRCDPAGDYVAYISRITSHKRQWLLAESMAHVRSDVRLVLAGAPDTPGDLAALSQHIERAGVGDRVTVLGHWISEAEKRDLIAGSLACAYIPFEEDSYGYPSLESALSRKPILTCTDSGGTLELVEHETSGLVVEADAKALGAAIDRMARDRNGTRAMGQALLRRTEELQISWDFVVENLLA